MKTIELTQGKEALVDDQDFAHLSQWKWCAIFKGRGWYAQRRLRRKEVGDGPRGTTYMHNQIIGGRVDHRDGNGLNNQRSNLRPAGDQQNKRAFRQKPLGKSSRFRGVHWHSATGKWKAEITVDYRNIYLGVHASEEAAARAYDEAARQYFGEFASPNFPGTLPQ